MKNENWNIIWSMQINVWLRWQNFFFSWTTELVGRHLINKHKKRQMSNKSTRFNIKLPFTLNVDAIQFPLCFRMLVRWFQQDFIRSIFITFDESTSDRRTPIFPTKMINAAITYRSILPDPAPDVLIPNLIPDFPVFCSVTDQFQFVNDLLLFNLRSPDGWRNFSWRAIWDGKYFFFRIFALQIIYQYEN